MLLGLVAVWVGTQNLGFRCHGEMGLGPIEQGFSSFFAKFFAYVFDNFSPKELRNFEKSSNMPKIWHKMNKSLDQLIF